MPNKFHPDVSQAAGSAQFADGQGNFVGKATGSTGSIQLVNGVLTIILPTSAPATSGAIWNNAGTVTVVP